jgi:hypothetical protein
VVIGIVNHRPFTDSDVVNASLLEQDNHVFQHPGSRDHSPLGIWADLSPKDNVGLYKGFRGGWDMIQPATEVNRLADGLQWGLVTDYGHF